MKRQYFPWYAIALAILIVGLVFAGVPAATLLIALVVVACPVMMMFMMGVMGVKGGHGHGSRHEDSSHEDSSHQADVQHVHRPTPGQP